MSGVILTSSRASLIPTSVDPDTYDDLPVLPSVRRTFTQDDELITAVEIYGLPRDHDMVVVTSIQDARGEQRSRRETKVSVAELNAAGGRYRHAVQIPVPEMSGDFALTIEAFTVGSPRDTVSRRVAFNVAPR